MESKRQSHNLSLRAVIFDCDGILVDTEPLHYRAFQKILAPLGLAHDFQHYMEHFIGFDDRDAFLHAFKEGGRHLDALTLESLINAKAKALQEEIEQGVRTFPGVVELVRELWGRGTPMAVASGALRHEVHAFVKSLGLNGAFCAVVAADDVKKSKPDPETYILALERLRRAMGWGEPDAANCIAFEDTPAGIESAKSAGLYVVGVTNSFEEKELRAADHIVGSLAGLDYSELSRLLERGRNS